MLYRQVILEIAQEKLSRGISVQVESIYKERCMPNERFIAYVVVYLWYCCCVVIWYDTF